MVMQIVSSYLAPQMTGKVPSAFTPTSSKANTFVSLISEGSKGSLTSLLGRVTARQWVAAILVIVLSILGIVAWHQQIDHRTARRKVDFFQLRLSQENTMIRLSESNISLLQQVKTNHWEEEVRSNQEDIGRSRRLIDVIQKNICFYQGPFRPKWLADKYYAEFYHVDREITNLYRLRALSVSRENS